jgi:hypothetical protein
VTHLSRRLAGSYETYQPLARQEGVGHSGLFTPAVDDEIAAGEYQDQRPWSAAYPGTVL